MLPTDIKQITKLDELKWFDYNTIGPSCLCYCYSCSSYALNHSSFFAWGGILALFIFFFLYFNFFLFYEQIAPILLLCITTLSFHSPIMHLLHNDCYIWCSGSATSLKRANGVLAPQDHCKYRFVSYSFLRVRSQLNTEEFMITRKMHKEVLSS